MNYKELVNEIKMFESFEPMPYSDPEGYPTIGYGTLLPLTEEEAEMLLVKRLNDTYAELRDRVNFFDELPDRAKMILLNMGYNLGVPKLMEFRRMWAALKEKDYNKAANEMLDSLWAKQVGRRATYLAAQMRKLGSNWGQIA